MQTFVEPQHAVRRSGSLLEVTPDLACFQDRIVNLYFFGENQGNNRSWVLIDAGLPFSATRIAAAAAERFGPEARPSAIILTHGHFDHIGAAADLAQRWDVPIYAHLLEMPYLTGQSSYPPPDPAVGGGAMSFLSRFYPRGPIDLGDRMQLLPGNGSVPYMPGWRWIHTPGHTPGHVSLFRESDRTLIAGDAFVTVRQESVLAILSQHQEVRRPPAYYTPDWQAAGRSVQALAELEPNLAATGHGLPMAGEQLRQQLHTLARDFDRVAIPAHGRYIHQPAIANERGVVSVPPPVTDPALPVVAGIGIAGVVGAMLLSGQSSSDRRQRG